MKRILYVLLIAAAMVIPTEPQELGKLKAVEVVYVHRDDAGMVIETDTGDYGEGATIEEAIEDLKATTPGTVYLDTAEYLLLSEAEGVWVEQLRCYLKGNVRMCLYRGKVERKETAVYLRAHQPIQCLGTYQEGTKLQTVVSKNGRLKLE